MSTPFNFVDPNQQARGTVQGAPAQAQVPTPQAPGQSPPEALGATPAAPPASTEERAQRVSGWTKFLDVLKNDPSVQQFMIQAGSTLLQGQRPGEQFNGLVGRALQGGNLAGQFIRQNQLNAGQKQQEIELEAERTAAASALAEQEIVTSQDQLKTSKLARTQSKAAHPLAIKLSKAELRKLEDEAAVAGLDRKTYVIDKLLERQKLQADTALTTAQSKADLGRAPTVTESILSAVKAANPGMTEAQANQAALTYIQNKELDKLTTAAIGSVFTDDTTRAAAEERARRRLNPNKTPLPSTGGKGDGSSRSSPKSVASQEDIDALPAGTWVQLPDGRTAKTQ